MLSQATLSFLSGLQQTSHAAYPEGGLLYTYVEASNQAHTRYPLGSAASAALSREEITELGRFLQASQGDYHSTGAGAQFVSSAEQLMNLLQVDLAFDDVSCRVEDGGYDMEAKLKMARRSNNRFFELSLWWSVD